MEGTEVEESMMGNAQKQTGKRKERSIDVYIDSFAPKRGLLSGPAC